MWSPQNFPTMLNLETHNDILCVVIYCHPIQNLTDFSLKFYMKYAY